VTLLFVLAAISSPPVRVWHCSFHRGRLRSQPDPCNNALCRPRCAAPGGACRPSRLRLMGFRRDMAGALPWKWSATVTPHPRWHRLRPPDPRLRSRPPGRGASAQAHHERENHPRHRVFRPDHLGVSTEVYTNWTSSATMEAGGYGLCPVCRPQPPPAAPSRPQPPIVIQQGMLQQGLQGVAGIDNTNNPRAVQAGARVYSRSPGSTGIPSSQQQRTVAELSMWPPSVQASPRRSVPLPQRAADTPERW